MTLYYQNVRGINSNQKDFYLNILTTDFDIYCLTETWLNKSVSDNALFPSNYKVYRRDRDLSSSQKKKGGGVLIAVKKCFQSNSIEFKNNIEAVLIQIQPNSSNNSKIFICNVYFPPLTPAPLYKEFFKYLTQYTNTLNSSLIITGDFNLPDITWKPNYTHNLPPNDTPDFLPSNWTKEASKVLISSYFKDKLTQINNIFNYQHKLLDLILINSMDLTISEVDNNSCITKIDSYHPPILINIMKSFTHITKNYNVKTYNFKKCNLDGLLNDLSKIDWDDLENLMDPSEMAISFSNIITNCFKNNIPLMNNKKSDYPTWYSTELKILIKIKNKHRLKSIKYNCPNSLKLFKEFRNSVKLKIKECYNNHLLNIEKNMKSNIKYFWSFVNKKRKNHGYPGKMIYNKKSFTNPVTIANCFAKHFKSVFPNNPPCPLHNPSSLGSSEAIQLNITETLNALKILKLSYSSGPDNIPSFILKAASNSLSYPLTLIYNRSLETGIFPKSWKSCNIFPIHKSDSKNDIKNYRPISILSACAKTFELIMKPYFTSSIYPLISSKQHGFIPKRSTTSNLITITTDLSNSFNNSSQTDAIYIDFSKAFDKIDHEILISKLKQTDIHPSLITWSHDYLTDRSFNVIFDGYKSSNFTINAGVPQGSILGPILFILYVNDLPDVIKSSNCLMYADDVKIYREIRTNFDFLQLNSDLNNISDWCINNKMSINTDKTFFISYTNKHDPIKCKYQLTNNTIKELTSTKDLGVIFDSKLSFNQHINSVYTKAYRSLGFIHHRSKEFQNSSTLIYLYKTLTLPILEYASTVWNPYQQNHRFLLEKIQKKFTKSILFNPINVKRRCERLSGLAGNVKSRSQRLLKNITLTPEGQHLWCLNFFYSF